MKALGASLSIQEFRQLVISAQLARAAASAEISTVVERTGPVRTLGGVDVYLALRARIPGLRREALEDAVERRQVQVLPAARGCIYLVSERDAQRVLGFAAVERASRDSREYARAGIQANELENLAEKVIRVLDQGRLSTVELRKKLPPGSVRSLGDAGKKVGISSTLPPTLRLLEFQGRVQRFMEGRRLDSERYLWGVSTPSSSAAGDTDPIQLNRGMAEIYFQAARLGSLKMFASWSGLSQRDARTAVHSLELEEFQVEGQPEPFLGRPDPAVTAPQGVAFLPFEDNLIALLGGPRLLVEPCNFGVPVPVWGRSRSSTLGEVRHSTMRTIIADNQIAGFWEFNPQSGKVETCLFAKLPSDLEGQVQWGAQELGHFIADELGHGRSFSLDSDKALSERVEFIRGLQGSMLGR